MKRYKKETNGKLEIGEIFHAKRFVLTVDRKLCKGCDICKLICPREAIIIKPTQKGPDGKTLAPVIDIDESKCDFHGICAAACPFSAITITVDSREELPVVTRDVFPEFVRDIEIDRDTCEPGCAKCETACPLGIITVKQDAVEIQTELCAGCQACYVACPAYAVKVTKFIEGSLTVNAELCPDGCHMCLDVCPVNALTLESDNKIRVNDLVCMYCGACKNVCPVPEALELVRTSVRHTKVESGAWNKALEKMTSTEGLNRELMAKRAQKAREAIANLKMSR